MSKVMGIDAITRKKCTNPEKQVYFFASTKKKNPFNNIQVAKTAFKKTHVYNKGDKNLSFPNLLESIIVYLETIWKNDEKHVLTLGNMLTLGF